MIGIAHAYQPNTIFSIPLLYTNIMAKITEAAFWINLLKKMVKSFLKDKGFKKKVTTNHLHVVPHKDQWAIKKKAIFGIHRSIENRKRLFAKLKH